MGLLTFLTNLWKPDQKEDLLCPLPAGGEVIVFDEDEQAGIDSSLQEFFLDEDKATMNRLSLWAMDGRYLKRSSEIEKHDASASVDEVRKRLMWDILRSETETFYYLAGLKCVAYARYGAEQLIPAAQTCMKTLGVIYISKRTSGYSGDGESEIWFMLAHIHARASKFRVAGQLLNVAKKTAKQDGSIQDRSFENTIGRSIWNSKIAALAQDVKSKTNPTPISNFHEAAFRMRGDNYVWQDARN